MVIRVGHFSLIDPVIKWKSKRLVNIDEAGKLVPRPVEIEVEHGLKKLRLKTAFRHHDVSIIMRGLNAN